jgi:GNAT superfamily N-acetyltransferase
MDSKFKARTYAKTRAGDLFAIWLPNWTFARNVKWTNTVPASSGSRVPIRSLDATHTERIFHHLISLSARDRYLRFGYFASDRNLEVYVSSLNFERDELFGIYDRSLLLIAVAHIAYSIDDICNIGAEFGVSVLSHARRRGYGARLFQCAVTHACNRNISMLLVHALSENQSMLTIATNAGARVKRYGCESEAFLQLYPPNMKSWWSELFEEQLGQGDYRIKLWNWQPTRVPTELEKPKKCDAVDQT